ncbi:kinase-like domain-containing protein [Gigaspora rosea]|uniref:Kinase-like domain-containing protein n=1 Tax=Gigaspora rosea TaxID=44941 RepID=A0A397VRW1_9GLOM|nr:kinase-like domain-containing protein [Gigaspora rosea]
MELASLGCLRKNLRDIAKMEWKDKLNLLQCITSDLQIIHSHDLVHRDLHSGNILQNDFKNAYIADLGICGILPYIAPEILNKQPYTKASDVYSFGIIMWEILYGKPVAFVQESKLQSKFQYQFQVCDGLRPPVYESSATCYVDLMKKCWHTEPEKRPTANEVYEIFSEWQNNESILLELSESDKKSQNIKNEDTGMKINIDSLYKSKFISFNNSNQGNYKVLLKILIYILAMFKLFFYR